MGRARAEINTLDRAVGSMQSAPNGKGEAR